MILAAVFRYLARWGVPVIHMDEPGHRVPIAQLGGQRVTHDAPYGYAGGIHWPTRTIVTALDGSDTSPKWEGCLLVHELSHVLVEQEPDEVDEVGSAMLALDYIGCRLHKLAWSEWMEEYEVNGRIWSMLSRQVRAEALAQSRAVAIHQGLLDEHGRPTYRRLPRSS